MYDRHEMHTDAVDEISAMGWMQTEFSWIADPEEIVDAVAPIVWQAALDFIYEQPMTLTRDTLIERMKRWMEAEK